MKYLYNNAALAKFEIIHPPPLPASRTSIHSPLFQWDCQKTIIGSVGTVAQYDGIGERPITPPELSEKS